MDDKLKGTIKRIVQLTQQNPEFGVELRKALKIESSTSSVYDLKESVKHIKQYLGLDYYVDSKPSLIDYSFISNSDVRNQLISDNREMQRYRHGTRSHKIDFDEVCRYSLLQAEMLLNYFYETKNENFDGVRKHIKKYNETAKGLDTAKSIGGIKFNVKLWAFKKECSIDELSIWDNIREVRNKISHRSTDSSIKDLKTDLEKMGAQFYKNGKINWEDKENTKKIKDSHPHFQNNVDIYKFLVWSADKPYQEIFDATKTFADYVKKALEDNTNKS